MPNGVPVATVALNAAQNAGILAAQIIGSSDKTILKKMSDFKKGLQKKVLEGETGAPEYKFLSQGYKP
jgi:5-(carboxyamino)imidazole ribonucleotide mutase